MLVETDDVFDGITINASGESIKQSSETSNKAPGMKESTAQSLGGRITALLFLRKHIAKPRRPRKVPRIFGNPAPMLTVSQKLFVFLAQIGRN